MCCLPGEAKPYSPLRMQPPRGSSMDRTEAQVRPSNFPNLSGLKPNPWTLMCVIVGFRAWDGCSFQALRGCSIEGITEAAHAATQGLERLSHRVIHRHEEWAVPLNLHGTKNNSCEQANSRALRDWHHTTTITLHAKVATALLHR